MHLESDDLSLPIRIRPSVPPPNSTMSPRSSNSSRGAAIDLEPPAIAARSSCYSAKVGIFGGTRTMNTEPEAPFL